MAEVCCWAVSAAVKAATYMALVPMYRILLVALDLFASLGVPVEQFFAEGLRRVHTRSLV
jgi:hypothetical protein